MSAFSPLRQAFARSTLSSSRAASARNFASSSFQASARRQARDDSIAVARTASHSGPSSSANARTLIPLTVAAVLSAGWALGSDPIALESRPSFAERLKLKKAQEAQESSQAREEIPAVESPTVAKATSTTASPTDPSPAEGDAEASQESAYDPSTGEINWECPCLGGMAQGPCGEEFKDAFACFVYSEGEPKGIECVDKFKLMQDCFRKHPDVYAEEIEDEEADAAEAEQLSKKGD